MGSSFNLEPAREPVGTRSVPRNLKLTGCKGLIAITVPEQQKGSLLQKH